MQRLKARQLRILGCNHQLAADFVRNVLFAAKPDHFLDARDRQPRLRRSGLVIKPAMQNPAVVSSLVPAHCVLFLQNRDREAGQSPAQLDGRGQTNDATAHDDDAL